MDHPISTRVKNPVVLDAEFSHHGIEVLPVPHNPGMPVIHLVLDG